MAGETLVFFPKYTTLCGTTTYYSDPYEVTGYKTLSIEHLLIAAVGAGAVVSGGVEGSSDMITWTALIAPALMTAGTILSQTVTDPPRYIRVTIVTSAGTNMSATLWSKGVARDS